MRTLLDTHTLLWWLTDDARLSPLGRSLIADAANEILVSAASAWEISTKHRIGKLRGFENLIGEVRRATTRRCGAFRAGSSGSSR